MWSGPDGKRSRVRFPAHKKLNSCPSGTGIDPDKNLLAARLIKLFHQPSNFKNQIQKPKQKGIGDGDGVSRKIPKQKEFRRGVRREDPMAQAGRRPGGTLGFRNPAFSSFLVSTKVLTLRICTPQRWEFPVVALFSRHLLLMPWR